MEYTIGTAVFNDWVIVREIGQGATGHVYEIKKNGCGEEIRSALKVIRIPKSPSDVKAVMSEGMTREDVTDYFKGFVDEILREIRIMVSLKDHPNIVTYEDHCVITHEDGIGWDILIKMELLTPLQEWQMDHPMNENDIVRLGCEISSALSYAADHHLIHRDVKPENIFVDSMGRFKMGDFGIARTIEKTTGGLSKKGTESYMAPEVYLGKQYNTQVDIYSLGIVLYRFLNDNRLPFYPPITEKITYSDRETALLKRIQGFPVPEPANGNAELKAVVLKACEYLPENRYASMSELHNALQNVGGTIVDPPPLPKSDKQRKWKRWVIGIAGVVAALSCIAVNCMFYGRTKKFELGVSDGSKEEIVDKANIFLENKQYEDAVKLYQVAADQKNAEAQCNLAYCYMMGYGVDVDAKEIAELFKKAAKQENPPAEYYLGWCYENGYGIDADYEQARNWYKKASDHGVEAAKLALHFYGSESYSRESR